MIIVEIFKRLLQAEGLPVSDGPGLDSTDIGSYARFVAADQYRQGQPYNLHSAMYGLAYPELLPLYLASQFMTGEFDNASVGNNGVKPNGTVKVGSNISNSNFLVHNTEEMQLALGSFYSGVKFPTDVSKNGVFYMKTNHEGRPWVFLYSIAAATGYSIDDYDVTMSLSSDPDTGEGDPVVFTLNEIGEFVGAEDTIADNYVDDVCVQNVQSFNFEFIRKHLDPDPVGEFVSGKFSVTLEATNKETSESFSLTAQFVVGEGDA